MSLIVGHSPCPAAALAMVACELKRSRGHAVRASNRRTRGAHRVCFRGRSIVQLTQKLTASLWTQGNVPASRQSFTAGNSWQLPSPAWLRAHRSVGGKGGGRGTGGSGAVQASAGNAALILSQHCR